MSTHSEIPSSESDQDFGSDERIFVTCSPVEGCILPDEEFQQYYKCSIDASTERCHWLIIQKHIAQGIRIRLNGSDPPRLDLFRDTFIDVRSDLIHKLHNNFNHDSKPTTYAWSAGFNAANNALKKKGNQTYDLGEHASTSAQQFDSLELCHDFREVFKHLSPRQQKILVLYLNYHSITEACKKEGLSHSTISKEFASLRKILRKRLGHGND